MVVYTGADIDATNDKKNFRPVTVVNLGPKQFPIRTGNGVVYAECVGEVWLSLKGKDKERRVMRIKYTLFLRNLPVNIVSGERFYRSGGYLERNRLIDPEGNIITYIDPLRRGFFLWIYNQPEPLKLMAPKKTILPLTHALAPRRVNYTENSVIELKRPLYGLKQSGTCWQENVRGIMKRKVFFPLISDNAIYHNKQAKIVVASYVDDFLLMGSNRGDLESLVKGLNSEVALNDLGDTSWFLGVRIQRNSPTGNVRLDQKQYIERSLQEIKIKSKAIETPISVRYKQGLRRHTGKATANELFNYQRLVGKYNFSSCMTRCDTSYTTSLMARFMCNPSPENYQYMLRIPQYLSNCLGRGILYEKNHRHREKYGIYGLHCAVDASFADDYDTAKSTTGYVIFMAGSLII